MYLFMALGLEGRLPHTYPTPAAVDFALHGTVQISDRSAPKGTVNRGHQGGWLPYGAQFSERLHTPPRPVAPKIFNGGIYNRIHASPPEFGKILPVITPSIASHNNRAMPGISTPFTPFFTARKR